MTKSYKLQRFGPHHMGSKTQGKKFSNAGMRSQKKHGMKKRRQRMSKRA